MSVHDGLTRETSSAVFGFEGQINGKEVCRMMNHIMNTTRMQYVLRIGDKPYRVIRVTPLMHDMIRVSMEGRGSADVYYNTKFDFYLAFNIEDYKHPLRQIPVTHDQPI